MESCIIVINSGHDLYMGYAFRNETDKKSLKGSNIPILKTTNNQLIGVTNNEELLTNLKLNPILLSTENTIPVNVNKIRQSIFKEWPKKAEIIFLLPNNFVYRYCNKNITIYGEYQEPYLAFGKGSDLALGVLYGMESSRYTPKDKIEVCLKLITRFYPELNNTGYLNI